MLVFAIIESSNIQWQKVTIKPVWLKHKTDNAIKSGIKKITHIQIPNSSANEHKTEHILSFLLYFSQLL